MSDADPFADPAAFVDLPRMAGLALSPDGRRLVAVVQQPDDERARYVSSLWEIPLGPGGPQRLTHSAEGESEPAFLPDGTLLFTSARPPSEHDDAALWALPARGEADVLATRPGGLRAPVVASGSGAIVLGGTRLTSSTDGDDEQRRTTRRERGISAVLHDGMPIRYWDHELDVESDRLLLLDAAGGTPRDLLPDAGVELAQATWSVTADAATVAFDWRPRRPGGAAPHQVALLDVASGECSVLADEAGWQFTGPRISPDGRFVAFARERDASYETALETSLVVAQVATGERVTADLGDLEATEWVWAADSAMIFVAGDLHGSGAVLTLDPATGAVRSRLASDAVYSSLCPAPDGTALYALRSAHDSAPAPVRLDPACTDQTPRPLPTPAPTPPLPGSVEKLEVAAPDGALVHAWLFTPPPSDAPAPLMLWVHGGPFASANTWSWRWNPWLAVARGWAVALPDPALSTGYGQQWIERAWPYRADVVWRDLEAVLDAALARPGIAGVAPALLGGSFGGYMTNWIAGHTDRFAAIVTHAGLWALDQQHATTDNAHFKTSVFGRLADHPDWYAANSPHNTVDAIGTPMLIVHGNRDYRVPVSEALRMWWDLVSRWRGDPTAMPHRFLQFTAQNHWVLGPADAQIWHETVLGFCAQHVLGRPWTRPPLL